MGDFTKVLTTYCLSVTCHWLLLLLYRNPLQLAPNTYSVNTYYMHPDETQLCEKRCQLWQRDHPENGLLTNVLSY